MSLETILQVLLIVVGIGGIIFVHELGHFLVCKLSGVRVDAFSLGFPPTGIGIRRVLKGLRVSFFPGLLRSPCSEIGGIEEESPADRAGIRIGDRVLEIAGRKADRLDWKGLADRIAAASGPVPLVLLRSGRTVDATLDPPAAGAGLESLGILPPLAEQAEFVRSGREGWAVGLRPEERVFRAAGREFANQAEFQAFVDEAVHKGAGIVRMEAGRAEADAPRRRMAVAVRASASEPRAAFVIPLFGGGEGDTEYRLSCLPIGGYVKMAGDIPGETSGKPDEFLSKGVGVRGAVFAAGSFMNVVFGFLCFLFAYQVGVQSISPEVGWVEIGFPAARAGVQAGDRVLSINGAVVAGFEDIPQEAAYAHPAGGLRFEVQRGGERLFLPPADQPPAAVRYDPKQHRYAAGIYPVYTNQVEKMEKGKPFYAAGLRPKDRILEVEGTAVSTDDELKAALDRVLAGTAPGFRIVAERKGRRIEDLGEVCLPADVKRTRRIGAVTSWTLALERAVEQGPGAGALLAGDVLLRAQDAIPFHVRGIREALRRLGSEGRFPLTIRFEVLRGGNPVEVPVTVGGKDELEAFAATIPTRATITLSSISERSHLREAGIPEGAEIVAVGGRPVESLEGFLARMDENGDQPIALDWRTEGGPVQKSEARTIEGRAASLEDLGLLSLREKREFLRLGFFASLAVGAKKTVKFAVDVFRTLKGIFVGDIGAPNLGGPVLIVAASWHFAEYGLGKLLFFLGILSINLAIINLFPIPILDGGHLLFLSIEKAKGSPVSETIQAIAQYAGILVLLALMIYVTKNDISRFFLK